MNSLFSSLAEDSDDEFEIANTFGNGSGGAPTSTRSSRPYTTSDLD